MVFAETGTRFRIAQGLDGMHRLGLHPMHTPSAGVSRLFRARAVPHAAVGSVITDMRSSAPGIPIKKKTWPTVVMHRFHGARWGNSNFEHAYQFIFENHFVTIRSGLHGIEALGKARFVLSVGVKIPAQRHQGNRGKEGDQWELSGVGKSF